MFLKKLIFLVSITLTLVSCETQDPLDNSHYFSNDWSISEVIAPSYPFDETNETNPILLSFNKQGQYELQLKEQTCNGSYEADAKGSVRFTRNNCSVSCCDSEWDYYIITLIKKASSYIQKDDSKFFLYIDESNYIILEASEILAPLTSEN
ncbi:hypothetical protein [Carboxylicivirga sp. N1Y90]|uniref:hypothetical protein n=1 Tax=Carboxylicivirga fragile TaxID=3417571 RepID=UPI003D34D601|nr:hypothetical protein [Marinilabiliaceae bacterium N1Y90]